MDPNDYPLHDWIMDGAGWYHSDVCRKCESEANAEGDKHDNARMLPADVYAAQRVTTRNVDASFTVHIDSVSLDFAAWETEVPNGQFYVFTKE